MKHLDKWRETIDPFSLKFNRFELKEVMGYPHAGNDVFHVAGISEGKEIKGYLKVERQKTANIEREVTIIKKLELSFLPIIIDYSFDAPKYIITEEAEGSRLSYILGENKVMESLKYMSNYGKLLAEIHSIKIEAESIIPRNFDLPHEFYVENKLEYIERYLQEKKVKDNICFIHGDCHYANILWKGYRVSCLLDFELSGYGSREYDLAWALILRQGQRFLKTKKEREVFLETYSKYHSFSRDSFDYYMVLFGIFFYKISLIGKKEEDKEYRNIIIDMIKDIVFNRK